MRSMKAVCFLFFFLSPPAVTINSQKNCDEILPFWHRFFVIATKTTEHCHNFQKGQFSNIFISIFLSSPIYYSLLPFFLKFLQSALQVSVWHMMASANIVKSEQVSLSISCNALLEIKWFHISCRTQLPNGCLMIVIVSLFAPDSEHGKVRVS